MGQLGFEVSSYGSFAALMTGIYEQFDKLPYNRFVKFPSHLDNYFRLLYKGAGQKEYCFAPGEKFECPRAVLAKTDSPHIIVGFSGGKDSLAAAIKAKQEMLKPVLLYVSGINKSYPNERGCAFATAVAAGFPIIERVFSLPKMSSFKENPTKDQMILAIMLDYGLSIGASRYTMGLETSNFINTSNFLYNWSDTVEMVSTFNEFVRSVVPLYQWVYYIGHLSDSLQTIVNYNEKLLIMTTSCLTPYRFQAMRARQTEEKYRPGLLPNRCGVCWKCCVEYLNLVGLGVLSPNFDFMKYCFERFKSQLPIAFGAGMDVKSMDDTEILYKGVHPKFVDTKAIERALFPVTK